MSNLDLSIIGIIEKAITLAPTASSEELLELSRAARNLDQSENADVEIAINSRIEEISPEATHWDLRALGKTVANLLEREEVSFAGGDIGKGYLPAQHHQQGKYLVTSGADESYGSGSSKTWVRPTTKNIDDFTVGSLYPNTTFQYNEVTGKYITEDTVFPIIISELSDLPAEGSTIGELAYDTTRGQMRFWNGEKWQFVNIRYAMGGWYENEDFSISVSSTSFNADEAILDESLERYTGLFGKKDTASVSSVSFNSDEAILDESLERYTGIFGKKDAPSVSSTSFNADEAILDESLERYTGLFGKKDTPSVSSVSFNSDEAILDESLERYTGLFGKKDTPSVSSVSFNADSAQYDNQPPIISNINDSYVMTSRQNTVITASGADPEGKSITWSFEEVVSGSNYVVVGALGDDGYDGSVYIYNLSDLSATPTKLDTPAGATNFFGRDFEIIGDNLIVTADGDDTLGNNAGAAYVYDMTDLSISPTKITAPDGTSGNKFGYSVTSSSDKVIISSRTVGKVYIYDANDLTATPTILMGETNDFGNKVTSNSNYIFVSDPYIHHGGNRTGSVYVYDIDSLSLVTEIEHQANYAAYFGTALSANEEKLAVGGWYAGIVYVYDLNNLSSTPETTIYGSGSHKFGVSVGLSDNKLVVGASDQSNAYVYDLANLPEFANYQDDLNPNSSFYLGRLDPTNEPTSDDKFGYSVSVNNDNIVVGAYGDNNNTGSTYVYDANDLSATPTILTAFDGEEGEYYGSEVVKLFGAPVTSALNGTTVSQSNNVFTITPGIGDANFTLRFIASDNFGATSHKDVSFTHDYINAAPEIQGIESSYTLTQEQDTVITATAIDVEGDDVTWSYEELLVDNRPTLPQSVYGIGQISMGAVHVGMDFNAGSETLVQQIVNQISSKSNVTKITFLSGDSVMHEITRNGQYLIGSSSGSLLQIYDSAHQNRPNWSGFPTTYAISEYGINQGQDSSTHYTDAIVSFDTVKVYGTGTTSVVTYTDNLTGDVVRIGDEPQSQLNGTTVSQSDNIFTITPARQDANFNLKFIATDSVGNVATTTTNIILDYVNQPPAISGVDSTYTLTQGQDTVITASATDIEGDDITWSYEEVKTNQMGFAIAQPMDEIDLFDLSGVLYKTIPAPRTSEFHMSHGHTIKTISSRMIVGDWAARIYDEDNSSTLSGGAFLFNSSGDFIKEIFPPNPFDWMMFGYSVDISENRIVVGAYTTNSDQGSVYVYDIDGNFLFELTAYDGQSGDRYGQSVACNNNYILVSAPMDDTSSVNSGSAYLYHKDGTFSHKLSTPFIETNDYLGSHGSICMTDNRIAIQSMDDDKGSNAGAVYLYDGEGSYIKKITAPDGAAEDSFGYRAIDITDEYIVIGSGQDDGVDGHGLGGSVYVFDINGNYVRKIIANDPAGGGWFGMHVSSIGDNLFVTRPYDSTNSSATSHGSVYQYQLSNGSFIRKILNHKGVSDNQTYGGRGVTAFDLEISNIQEVTVTQSDNVFTVTPGTVDESFTLKFNATDTAGNVTSVTSDFTLDYVNQAPSVSGIESAYTLTQGQDTVITASATDPEGDAITWSFEEVITGSRYIAVTASTDDDGASNSGSVYVYDSSNLSAQPIKLSNPEPEAHDRFGYSVSMTADKLVVGAAHDDNPEANSGSVYVYDLTDLSAAPTKLEEGGADDRFGNSVATNSNYIFVTSPNDDDAADNAGAIYVYDINDLSATPTKLTPDNSVYGGVGVDGHWASIDADDNYMVVGAYDDNSYEGAAYVYDVSNLSATPTKLTQSGSRFMGSTVRVFDDVIIVGSQYANSYAGKVYVYDANNLSSAPTVLEANDGISGMRMFGSAIEANSDYIFVGAYAGPWEAFYRFDRSDLSAAPVKVNKEIGDINDGPQRGLGSSMRLIDNSLFVGANQGDHGFAHGGSLYVYDITDLSASPTLIIPNDLATGDNFGAQIAISSLPSGLNDVTVTQSDNVFTVTPAQQDANFTLKFNATDTAGNVTSVTSDFNYDYNAPPVIMGIESVYTLTQGVNQVIVPMITDAEGETVTMTYEEVLSEGVPSGLNGTTITQSGNDFTIIPGNADANFTLRFTATDTAGNTDTRDADFSLNYNVNPVLSGIGSSYTLTQDQDTVITAAISDADGDPITLTYAVTSGDMVDTTIEQSSNIFTVTPGVQDASFQITFTATDPYGGTSEIVSDFNYDYNAPPVISGIEPVYTLTQGVDEVIVGMSSDADGDAVTWSFAEVLSEGVPSGLNGTTITQNGGEFTVTPGMANANFTIRFTLTDTAGNTDTRDADFSFTYVNQAPAVSGIESAYTLTTGQDTVITGTATDLEGDAITWSYEEVLGSGSGYVIIPANGEDNAKGAVYVYDANDLSATPTRLTAFDRADGDYFGYSSAASPDKIVVGALGDDDEGSLSGSAYVYDLNDLSAQPTKLTAFDGAERDRFGGHVAINSDNIFIGAYTDNSDAGSVYVYDANDLSATPTKLTAPDGDQNGRYGESIVVSDDKLFIGSYRSDGNETDSGAVYVYDLNDLSAAPIKVTAFDGSSSDTFAHQISVYGDKMAVTAWTDDDNGSNTGSAYVYDLNDLSVQPTKLTAFDADTNGQFGVSSAFLGDKILIGARYENSYYGAVYVYDANDLAATPTKMVGPSSNGYFGESISTLIVPAPSALNGTTVTQSDNVFTVTPAQQDATFQLTFKATDTSGNVTSVTSDFDFTYVNQAPAVSGIESAYTLTQGQDTVITAEATDPEDDAVTWSFEEVMSGSSVDPDTIVMINFDADFADLGNNNLDLSNVGSPSISNSVYKTGTGSLDLTPNNYLIETNNSNIVIGNSDFTVECWLQLKDLNNNYTIASSRTSGDNRNYWMLSARSNGSIMLQTRLFSDFYAGVAVYSTLGHITANTWHHVAGVRKNGELRIFIDGTDVTDGDVNDGGKSLDQGHLLIGAFLYTGYESYMNGYIDNFKISKQALYNENFQPSSDAFSTSALNGTTVTQSDNVFTITPGNEETSFQLTFKATDSEGNVTSTTSDFTVVEAPTPQMGDLFIGSDGYSTGDFNNESEVDAWTKTSNTSWLTHRSGEGGHMEMGWGTNNQIGAYIELDVVPNTEYTISFSGTATSGAPVGHANYRDAYVNVRVVDSEPVGTNAAALILQTTPSTTGGTYPNGSTASNGWQPQTSKSGYQTLSGTITPHGSKLTIQILNVDKVVQYFDDFSVTGLVPV